MDSKVWVAEDCAGLSTVAKAVEYELAKWKLTGPNGAHIVCKPTCASEIDDQLRAWLQSHFSIVDSDAPDRSDSLQQIRVAGFDVNGNGWPCPSWSRMGNIRELVM